MTQATHPSLFLSHGSPMIALEDSPAARFLDRLGPAIDATFGRPRAVVVVSPHTATRVPVLSMATRYEAVHDFGGFPEALYQLRYAPPGAPVPLLQSVADQLRAAKVPVQTAASEGIDHGIWTLLLRMWPDADVPVIPLSLVPNASPEQQWAVGQALGAMTQPGLMVIGSGAFTHHLGRYFSQWRSGTPSDGSVAADVAAFQDWVHDKVRVGDWTALMDYRRLAPEASRQHPTDEHWLPFYIAGGAGGADVPGVRLHDSVDGGVLAMDGYAFGAGAARLASALGVAA